MWARLFCASNKPQHMFVICKIIKAALRSTLQRIIMHRVTLSCCFSTRYRLLKVQQPTVNLHPRERERTWHEHHQVQL